MSSPLKVLVVEDSATDGYLLRTQLTEVVEFEFAIEHVERLSQACELLRSTTYDAILLDLGLPDSFGAETVRRVREISDATPLVLLSAGDDRDVIDSAMRAGADNFIIKGTGDGNRIALAILYARNKRARTQAESSPSKCDLLQGIENNLVPRVRSGELALPQALDQLMRSLETYKDFDYKASVLLYDHTTQRLHHGAAPSLPDEYNKAIDGIQVGLGVGSCGTAVFCKHSIYVVDIDTDPLWRNYRSVALPHNLRACWSVPIFDREDNVIGTFAMYYSQRRSPSQEERDFIHAAARTAAELIIAAKNHELLAS